MKFVINIILPFIGTIKVCFFAMLSVFTRNFAVSSSDLGLVRYFLITLSIVFTKRNIDKFRRRGGFRNMV